MYCIHNTESKHRCQLRRKPKPSHQHHRLSLAFFSFRTTRVGTINGRCCEKGPKPTPKKEKQAKKNKPKQPTTKKKTKKQKKNFGFGSERRGNDTKGKVTAIPLHNLEEFVRLQVFHSTAQLILLYRLFGRGHKQTHGSGETDADSITIDRKNCSTHTHSLSHSLTMEDCSDTMLNRLEKVMLLILRSVSKSVTALKT